MSLILVVLLLVSIAFALTAISGAPWVPARTHDIQRLVSELQCSDATKYIELGCGEGRVLKAIAQTGAQAYGYELNPVLWVIAWLRCVRQPNAHVRLANFWNIQLHTADIVLTFLVPRTMPRLAKQVSKQMQPGSILVSYAFPLPGHTPFKRLKPWLLYKMSSKASKG